MNEKLLKLLNIKLCIFEKALNIIFDILIEMYEKGGLAYVEPDRDNNDLTLKYTNISIEILKYAAWYEVTKTMLELSYIKIVKEENPTTDQLLEMAIIKHLIPYIQDSNIEYIIAFQGYFCSQDTIYKNCTNLKKYQKYIKYIID